MNKDSKILVLGSNGLVGSALIRRLSDQGYSNLFTPKREDVDLIIQANVFDYFQKNRPDYVFMAAGKVGGIVANSSYPADFIYENLTIQNNVFGAAFKYPVQRFLFLGSSCIYPKNSSQPIKEEYLLTGELEKTNAPYAIAKISGLKTAEAFRLQYNRPFFSVIPTNLYGVNDNFDHKSSHVIPGLIARLDRAIKNGDKVFKVWGTGRPRREFLYVDDMADACIHLMNYQDDISSFINIGTGEDIEISELAQLIAAKMNFQGSLVFDSMYPDGTMQKLLDVSRIKALGWKPKVSLSEGLDRTIQFFKDSRA